MQRNPRLYNELNKSKTSDISQIQSDVFFNELVNTTIKTTTENGACTNSTSKNDMLDFYMLAGSMRNRSSEDIINLYTRASIEDPLRALKCIFYLGDIRGGLGERRTFNILLKHIAKTTPDLLKKNIHLIPYYNRWDSIYSLFNTSLQPLAIELIANQLKEDLNNSHPSLLAKWLYSPNTTNKEHKHLGVVTALQLHLAGKNATLVQNIRAYREVLSTLRTKINVVEKLITNKDYSKINYSSLPSHAAMRYSDLFQRKDSDRYLDYLNQLAEDKAKVNAATLFPHNIVKKVFDTMYSDNIFSNILLNKQWESMPNYITSEDVSGLVVADVSGSMSCGDGTPLYVSIALAMYMAERSYGPYHNKFITFSEIPQLVEIKGRNLCERVKMIDKAHWEMNTDIFAVFKLILDIAKNNNLDNTVLPKYIYIISDMEFDKADHAVNSSTKKKTLFEDIKSMYEIDGYSMPKLVFWNVNAKNNQSPMSIDDNGWLGVSGFSTTIFKALMNGEFIELIEADEETKKIKGQSPDAIELMKFVLDSDRYSLVNI